MNALSSSPGYQPLRQAAPRGLPLAQVDNTLPDISGLARLGDDILAVRDSKLESDSERFGKIDPTTGEFQAIPTDWSATGRARDLEALTSFSEQPGRFLAVEASGFKGQGARLFELQMTDGAARSERSYPLPEFAQEIEGMAQKTLPDGRELVVLGGRGGDGQAGRLYWGVLEAGKLSFSDKGLAGVAVDAPKLANGQRDITDLQLDADGTLWAAASHDLADDGPFQSSVYKLGSLSGDLDNPVEINRGQDVFIGGTKVEGLVRSGPGFLVGSDDEAFGGQVGYLMPRL